MTRLALIAPLALAAAFTACGSSTTTPTPVPPAAPATASPVMVAAPAPPADPADAFRKAATATCKTAAKIDAENDHRYADIYDMRADRDAILERMEKLVASQASIKAPADMAAGWRRFVSAQHDRLDAIHATLYGPGDAGSIIASAEGAKLAGDAVHKAARELGLPECAK